MVPTCHVMHRLELLAVDGLADIGDSLLVDACGVPALNSGEIRLALLISSAALPAVAHEEIRGRGKSISA